MLVGEISYQTFAKETCATLKQKTSKACFTSWGIKNKLLKCFKAIISTVVHW